MVHDVAPLRGGWRDWYDRHSVSAAEAMSNVRSGDHIFIPAPAGLRTAPLVMDLVGRADEIAPVDISCLPAFPLDWYTEEMAERIRIHVLFAGPAARDSINAFRADFRPWMVWAAHKSRHEGRPGSQSLDVALVAVSPPNVHGYCCFGNSLWDQKRVALEARTTIAVVDETIPFTFGDTWIHVSEIDCFVELAPSEARALPVPADEPWDEAIAQNVGSVVNDGDTIQVGLGGTTAAVVRLGAFEGRHDLAYWGELTLPGTIDLVRSGVINGRRLASHPGKFIATSAGNSPADTEFIADNPMFEFYEVDYIHNPRVIAKQENMVAINNALSVDLTGQIASGNIGPRTWSGTGGQLAFAMGAFMAKGGRSVTVLPSTAMGGTVSRISAEFPAGQVVTVPRDLADVIVTEYGVAQLVAKSLRQRAEELISIAHPDFRAELRKQASRTLGLRG